jgi:hypothetical protein
MPAKYGIEGDVRQALYALAEEMTDKGLKGKTFLGGAAPNLADLVRGALGCWALGCWALGCWALGCWGGGQLGSWHMEVWLWGDGWLGWVSLSRVLRTGLPGLAAGAL